MDEYHVLNAFADLGQSTRLDVFRLLIKAGEVGATAGDTSDTLGVRQNRMSANLSILSCGGRPELCQPVINELACDCQCANSQNGDLPNLTDTSLPAAAGLGTFERWQSAWVALANGGARLLGNIFQGLFSFLAALESRRSTCRWPC